MESSAITKPSEGLSSGTDDSDVRGTEHGVMTFTRKEIEWRKRIRARLRGTGLAIKPVSLLGRTWEYL